MNTKVLLILLIQFFLITSISGITAANNESLSDSINRFNSDEYNINQPPIQTESNNTLISHNSTKKDDKAKYNKETANSKKWDGMQAYWMWTKDVNNFDPKKLKNSGITDLFFVTKGTSGKLYYKELKKAIEKCKPLKIRVHAWIICFKDESQGSWVDQKNQSYQSYLRNITSNIITNYDVDGIHLDYVRYSGDESKNHAAWQQSGGTKEAVNTITNFVQSIYNIIKAKNHDLALSAAVMPQMEDNARLYAQDYGRLADYLDFLVPMIYRGTFKQDNAWIGTTTKWIVEHSHGKPVIAGIMTYHSDEDQIMLPPLELYLDVKIALQNGASGFALFRYGLTSEIPQIYNSTNEQIINETQGIERYDFPKTVPMQKTGLPLLLLLASFLVIITGFTIRK